MKQRQEPASSGWLVGVLFGGTAVVGGALAWATWPRAPKRPEARLPARGAAEPLWTEADVEAVARMLASENPRGSRALHIEQIHTQLRARAKGQSLFARITAGSGWGPQGERNPGGGVRPVSTEAPATEALRQLAREVLSGVHPSILPEARKFFEPAQQDRAFAVATRARQKQAGGLPLSKQEQRLIHYRRSAEAQRQRWLAAGAKYIGTIDEVEFYS